MAKPYRRILIAAIAAMPSLASADIYQWEYLNPSDWSLGKRESTVLCPGGAGVSAMPGAKLGGRDLTKAYLIGAPLTNASFRAAVLTNADFSNAQLDGADFAIATLGGASFDDATITWVGLDRVTSRGFAAAQFYSTASYKSGNLTGVHIEQNDVTGWSFAGKNLHMASFSRSTLSDADLTDAVITAATLDGIGLTPAQLYSTASYKNGDLRSIRLYDLDISGWDFSGKNLSRHPDAGIGAVFIYGTLIGSSFRGANLTESHFHGTKLSGADFTDAVITETRFTRSDLTAAQLYSTANYKSGDLRRIHLDEKHDMHGWDLAGLDLSGAVLDFSQLHGADLSGVNLAGAWLYSTQLINANLRGAHLTDVELSAAIVTDADFTDAVLRRVRLNAIRGFTSVQFYSTATYKSGDLAEFDFRGLDASGWDLAGKNLRGARLSGIFDNASFSGANLTNAVGVPRLSNASLSGADARGSFDLLRGIDATTVTRNMIHPDGSIHAVTLAGGERLTIRDYDGGGAHEPAPTHVTVLDSMTMEPGAILSIFLEQDAWDSTIALAPGIPVAINGGILELSFAPGADASSQVGRQFDLFDWGSTAPSGSFVFSSPYLWDTSALYTSGHVTLIADPGDADLDRRVTIADYLAIDRGFARGLTGWANGDFDGSSAIDAVDYFIIDQAYLSQFGPAAIHVGIPEPEAVAFAIPATFLALRRRLIS